MTNMSVSEYIRKRRLTLAAYELLKGQEKIIDLAVKYGYSSADSFHKSICKTARRMNEFFLQYKCK